MNGLLKHISRQSIKSFTAFLRAVYTAGANSFDPLNDEEMKIPTDGELLGLAVDHFGGVAAISEESETETCITPDAIPEEMSSVLLALEHGDRLAVVNGSGGYDLSEAFSSLIAQILREEITISRK